MLRAQRHIVKRARTFQRGRKVFDMLSTYIAPMIKLIAIAESQIIEDHGQTSWLSRFQLLKLLKESSEASTKDLMVIIS